MPATRETLNGETYRRDSKVWTKIGKNPSGSGFYVALGFAGHLEATRLEKTRTKRHAETISEGWFEDHDSPASSPK